MQESARSFHNLEWPAPGARVAGPVVWLRGWVVGKPGYEWLDLRVRHAGQTHLGVLGLPRTDLAAHFQAARSWLPAEFILGVPVSDGPVTLTIEVMDAHGRWHDLMDVALTVAPDGAPPPRIEGRLETVPGGTWTVRDAHHPFHGHLDQPGPNPSLAAGRAPVVGWLLDETKPLGAVLATTDALVFNHLEHSLTDEALAAKVPQHANARHARLRGAVDWPATLFPPACLRVYALSPDGTASLCFARRLTPSPVPRAETCHIMYDEFPAPVVPRELPALPSGRPRRLLVMIRSLLPNDATLRALDVVRHLTSSFRWAVRVVSAEDGPLRGDFFRARAETMVVDPGPLFAAGDADAVARALDELQRQIVWLHLDAVAVFDPVCGWAITLARRQGIPVLFDCSAEEALEPDPTGSPAVQAALRASWGQATAVCLASATMARAQSGRLGPSAGTIIAHWHSPDLPAGDRAARIAVIPLRAAHWLVQQHPQTAARWQFRQGPAGRMEPERLARLDEAFNLASLQRAGDWSVAGASLCLGPLFGRGPLRAVIDAAAAGIPLLAPRRAITEEIFAGMGVPLADEANPLAFAHALLAYEALPESFQREAAALAPPFRARHDPSRLLRDWERLLATVAAGRG
ncbi:MAG TPA: hypothetical protein VG734_14085 [Lacunisphaera sp.]|nr:hypothetical protein [Lacunisphaera sp.]